VQSPLDVATFGIGDQRQSFPRGSELLDLAAQPIEGCLLVGLLDLQRMPFCAWIPGQLSVIARAASSGQHGTGDGWQHPVARQAATVEPRGTTS
jgi:hypothetical protein